MSNLTGATIQNLVAIDLYITNDTTTDYFTNPPTQWNDDSTLMWAKFDGDLNAGNISKAMSILLQQLSQIKVKRRRVGDNNWTTLRTYNINENRDNLVFSFYDNTAVNDIEYEYALVYVRKNGTESNYITTKILSKFYGTFIGDVDNMYKFFADISYDSTETHQNVGVFEPIGRKYPIYVSNAETNYKTGNFKGKIIGDYLDTNVLDREQIVNLSNKILTFLTNKRAKILKDDNGNAWVVMITDNPSVSYINEIGRGLQDLNFHWSEISDIDDLESVGLVKTID